MASGGRINTGLLSDETFDLLCVVCKRKGKNTEAEKYCVECQDYYCLTCVKVHEDIPSLSGHTIFGKDQFPSGLAKMLGTSKTVTHAPMERCDRHTHNYIDIYCQNHDVVGCSICMAVDHRLCKDSFYIPDILQTKTITTTQEIQQKLESVSNTLTKHHESFKREKQKLLKQKTTMLEKVKRFRKEINERLDELEKNTTTDIEDKYNSFVDEIEKAMKVLQTNKTNVTAAQDKVASTGTNPSHIFVNLKKAQQTADTASINAEENKLQISVDVEFQAYQRIVSFLSEKNTLGQLKQKITRDASYMVSSDVQKKDALLQVAECNKYSVRAKSDYSQCNIVSACTLVDETILLSDYNNNKLKRLDPYTYTIRECYDLPSRPWQVCSINKQQAAVCLTDKKEIHFVSLLKRMTFAHMINTKFNCHGLAYANGNLYISDRSTSVYIYSVRGRKMDLFSPDQSGGKLFSAINSLAVSKDGSRIYVADIDHGLIILDNNGKVVGRFNGPQLRGAYDSCVTVTGKLLVCGFGSNNVLQFTLDGDLIGEVLKENKYSLQQAICYDQPHLMPKIIIGGKEHKIEVYYLK